jgi:hypothetical protein
MQLSAYKALPNNWTPQTLADWINANGTAQPAGIPQTSGYDPLPGLSYHDILFNGIPLSALGDLSAGTNTLGGQLLGFGQVNALLTDARNGSSISLQQQSDVYWQMSRDTEPNDYTMQVLALAAIGAGLYFGPELFGALGSEAATGGAAFEEGFVGSSVIADSAAAGTLAPAAVFEEGFVGSSVIADSAAAGTLAPAAAFEEGFVGSSVIADSAAAGTLAPLGGSASSFLTASNLKDAVSVLKTAGGIATATKAATAKPYKQSGEIIIPGTIYQNQPGQLATAGDYTKPALIAAALAGFYFLGNKK